MPHDRPAGSSVVLQCMPICLLVLFACGCGPRHLLALPDNLPESIGKRKLWNTPHAYIYAEREAVAGETEAWVDTLADYIEKNHEQAIGKGLVIVLDEDEDALLPSLEVYVRLLEELRVNHPRANFKPATLEERREKLKEGCIPEESAVRLFPIRPDTAILARLGLPEPLPDDVVWVMSCPSHRLMEAEMSEIAPAMLERKKGKAFRIMTAWAMPMAVPEAAKAFRLARDDFAFRLWCIRQEDWTPEESLAAIETHMKQRARQISPYLKTKPEQADNPPDEKREAKSKG